MKKFEKSYKDVMLYGVLGGIAETLGISSVLVRVLYLIFFVVGGGFLPALLYLTLAFFMPEKQIPFQD